MTALAMSDIAPFTNVKGLIFDLDGTLIDSAPDICVAVNRTLSDAGAQELDLDAVRSMIGNGVRKLVERAFEARGSVLGDQELDDKTAKMMAYYTQDLTTLTVFMPGVVAALEECQRRGHKMAIATNKPIDLTLKILDHFNLGETFDCVLGGDSCATRKPEPEMLYQAVEKMGLEVAECLMIGDSPADINAAINAGMRSIAIEGGYTNIPVSELGADLVLESFAPLHKMIEG